MSHCVCCLQHNATKSLCGHLMLPGAVGITANCSEAQEIIDTLQCSPAVRLAESAI
jgi:hypothetical protein